MAGVAEIWEITPGRSRSVSPENFTGAKGAGGMATEGTGAPASRELGRGWKVSPSIELAAGTTATLAEVAGPGVIQHIWLTTDRRNLRGLVLRMYWDDSPEPSVAVPLGDFFCSGWPGELALLGSEMIVVAPAGGLNSYWPMPFRSRARITLESTLDYGVMVYYQVSYVLRDVPDSAGYLHASWRRANPLGDPAVHTLLDTGAGQADVAAAATTGSGVAGRYVGTYMAIEPGDAGWWGEGELKFYLDGDGEFPTICGTGTEDYFGGAWNFDLAGRYVPYATARLGLPQVLPPDRIYQPYQRFGMYRWHTADPICFDRDLRVTVQALGWQSGGRYLPLTRADIATTAYWYQARPRAVAAPAASQLVTAPQVVPVGPSTVATGLRARIQSLLTRKPWRR
ncbi:DUF2961 domain-containing protein [Pseudonocardia eucalypti]|uniref:DUF2961 domain-containing protein n=1 Tax=Pseudonocardia eucalypti TaxID=648755 RepID=A0ABP9PHW7_9PSEU